MVAILEDDQVAEIFVERERQRGVVGNVYKGRVSKVLPGMQSSFVDIGLERDGFLYVSDVVEPSRSSTSSTPRTTTPRSRRRTRLTRRARGQAAAGRRRARARPRRRPQHRGPAEGRAGDPRPGRQGAARHQGRPADVARDDAGPLPRLHADGRPRRRVAQDRVARGARAACAASSASSASSTASPAASSSAPRPPAGPKEDIVSDLEYFHQIWTEIRQKMESSRAPAVVYRSRASSPSCCATC